MTTALVERSQLGAPADTQDLTVEDRAAAALLTCVARTGWSKTTFDDVAREAGCSRATLYRYFAGKPALLETTLTGELGRVEAELVDATAQAATLEDALVAIVGTGTRIVRDHHALGFLLANESEVILPHLAFSGGDRVLTTAGRVIAGALAPFLPEGADAARAGEWVARSTFVYVFATAAPFDLATEADARALVREFLLPSLSQSPVLTLDPVRE